MWSAHRDFLLAQDLGRGAFGRARLNGNPISVQAGGCWWGVATVKFPGRPAWAVYLVAASVHVVGMLVVSHGVDLDRKAETLRR